MHSHLRRNGIKPHKFTVEVHMTKVELKLAQQCRISVIFKRGEHRKETVNAPVLDKGVAYFDEKLSVPSIFYFDENKNSFIAKEATIALNMISSKAQRLVGITKFDLSTYLNNNIKETNVELKMDKCFDKNAKFYFRLNMMQRSDLDPCTSFRDDDEESFYTHTEGQSRGSASRIHISFTEKNQDLSGIILADNSDIGEGRSLSPAGGIGPESILEKTDLSRSRRQTTPNLNLSRNIDEKVSHRLKTDARILNQKEKPPSKQVGGPDMPKIRRIIKKEKVSPNQDQRIDETPRWSNNLRKSGSPLNRSKEKARASTPTVGELNESKTISPSLSRISEDRAISPKPNEIFFEKPNASNQDVSQISDDRSISPRPEEMYLEKPMRSNLDISAISDDKLLAVRHEQTERPTKSNPNISVISEDRYLSAKAEQDENLTKSNPDISAFSEDKPSSQKPDQNEKLRESNLSTPTIHKDKSSLLRHEQIETPSTLNSNIPTKNESRPPIQTSELIFDQKLDVIKIESSTQTEEIRDRLNEDLRNPQNTILEEKTRRILELETQITASEQTTKNLYDQLQFSNREYLILSKDYDELKQQYNVLFSEFQVLQNNQKDLPNGKKIDKRADFELNIYKEKVITLQREIEELKSQKVGANKTPDTVDQLEPYETVRNDSRKKSSSVERTESAKIEEYKNVTAKLRNDLKEAKRKLNEFQTVQNKDIEKNKITISELTVGISKVRKEVELRDQKIYNLESYVKELEDEIASKRQQEEENSKLQSEDLSSPNIRVSVLDLRTNDISDESYYKRTIQDLLTQNSGLKKELDQVKKILSLNHIDEVEEHNTSGSGSFILNKQEGEEDTENKALIKLEAENSRLTAELKKSKMGWASADIERYNLMNIINENNDRMKTKEERVDFLETEVFSLKTRLAEVVNIIMEYGGVELLDKVEDIVAVDTSSRILRSFDKKRSVLS